MLEGSNVVKVARGKADFSVLSSLAGELGISESRSMSWVRQIFCTRVGV